MLPILTTGAPEETGVRPPTTEVRMSRPAPRFLLPLLAAAALWLLGPAPVQGQVQEPVLERYVLQVGSTESFGAEAVLFDRFFGHGTARSRHVFTGPPTLEDVDGTGRLVLRVWRIVDDDEITFALLVFRVEVRGFDAEGMLAYSRTLKGFTFGDSESGEWRRVLQDIPAEVIRLAVTYFGNYE